MPDIQFFDAAGFFKHKISEVEQAISAKKAELEILLANRANLDRTIASLAALSQDHQRAIQSEMATLKEVLNTTERSIASLEGELEMLTGKRDALKAAIELLEVKQ